MKKKGEMNKMNLIKISKKANKLTSNIKKQVLSLPGLKGWGLKDSFGILVLFRKI